MSDVNRAGGIHADELHLDSLAASEVGVAESTVLFDDAVHLGPEPFFIQGEVDETRARDPYAAHDLRVGQGRDYGLSNRPGIHSHRAGELHGEAARKVAVLSLLRPLYGEVGDLSLRELAGCLGGVKRVSDDLGYVSSD